MKNEQLRGQYTLTRVRCSKISTDCPRVWLLQVSFRTSAHRQSFTVEVCVIDKNDNVPSFIEESMRGSVQLGLLKGTSTLSSKVTALLHLFPIGLPLVSPATREHHNSFPPDNGYCVECVPEKYNLLLNRLY